MKRISALLIAGPTASGKSRLALDVARAFGGVIINADSMQVYRDLRILTARPSEAEEASVPHRLFGAVDGAETYSIGRWLDDAARAITDVREQGLLSIVVGGTGLYFKALTQGLSDIPAVPEAVRARVREAAEGIAPAALHRRLAAVDPETAARLRPSDPQRILRALEVFEATGVSLAAFQAKRRTPPVAPGDGAGIFLDVPRATIWARSDARFEVMLEQGALNEVATLAARALNPALPVMRALGVPPLLRMLRGESDLATAAAETKRQTRQYIKRQVTFARNQLPSLVAIAPEAAPAWIARVLS